MNIIILGSGGCVSTPRACCNCRVCTEARQKGFPYARTGCNLFVEDVNLLIDTPEDINASLKEDNPLRKELFTLDEIDAIRKRYSIKRVVITHLEEDWGKYTTVLKNLLHPPHLQVAIKC